MAFYQSPPELGNQYEADPVLRAYLAAALPADVLAAVEGELSELGGLAGGELYRMQLEQRTAEPTLVQWDAWGKRIDRIELTGLWARAKEIAARHGFVATAYERAYGAHSRTVQFAKVYLTEPSLSVYSCPLAMTDGAARTLESSKNTALIERALPRLTSRDPNVAWTSGQWMTERTGGSDVAICESIAKQDDAGWQISGTKWFSSATTSEMALTLARPEGNPPGGSGLALFYLEVRDDDGALNGIRVNRLKDKLGTRMVPTAELTLDGTRATPVYGLTDGIKNISPMLTVTRTWNAVAAVSGMRRAIALAKDYAARRVAFGAPLADKPLHVDTLAWMEAEYEAAFLMAFRTVELLGRDDVGETSDEEKQLARLATPIAKLVTGKQAVAVTSEALEAFGGAGYVEDTGLPRMLRDSQVLPIWEGTTNVLSLDLLRVLSRGGDLGALVREIEGAVRGADATLRAPAELATGAARRAVSWVLDAKERGPEALEGGARRFALTLGRAWELALLVREASRAKRPEDRARFSAAARRFAHHGVDLVSDVDLGDDARVLASA